MRKVVSNREVPHLWAHQTQESGRNSSHSMYFEGKTIYSYGSHFPIATLVSGANGDTAVLFTTRRYSVTTSGHCSQVHRAIRHLPTFNVELTSNMFRYSTSGTSEWFAEWKGVLVQSYHDRVKEQTEKVARAKSNQGWQYGTLVTLVKEANDFCDFFGLGKVAEHHHADGTITHEPVFSVPESFDALKAQLAQVAAEKAKQERAKRKRIAKENEDKVKAWIAGESVNLPYDLPDTYLRVEGSEVVTSRGARFPIDHAIKGLAFVRAVKQAGKEYQRNGHTFHLGHYAIDRIDANGNVRAGCHFVKYPEVERIAPQLEALAPALAQPSAH